MNEYGRLRTWPREGGYHDQDPYEIQAMQTAWYVERLFSDPQSRTAADAHFLLWLDEDFDTWEERNAVTYLNREWMAEND